MIVAAKAASHSLSPIIILLYVVAIGAFYYFYLRPRNLKQKAARLESRKVEAQFRAPAHGQRGDQRAKGDHDGQHEADDHGSSRSNW